MPKSGFPSSRCFQEEHDDDDDDDDDGVTTDASHHQWPPPAGAQAGSSSRGTGGATAQVSVAGAQRKTDVTLAQMAVRVILRNLTLVDDLGDMPFALARPILEHCRPAQLAEIEDKSPHLKDHTNEIWRRNCMRDFLDLRRKADAGNLKAPNSWRRLYLRSLGEEQDAKAAAAQRIKQRYASHRAEKDAKRVVVSERPIQTAAASRKARRTAASAISPMRMTKGQSLLSKARSAATQRARLTAATTTAPAAASGRRIVVGAPPMPTTPTGAPGRSPLDLASPTPRASTAATTELARQGMTVQSPLAPPRPPRQGVAVTSPPLGRPP